MPRPFDDAVIGHGLDDFPGKFFSGGEISKLYLTTIYTVGKEQNFKIGSLSVTVDSAFP